MTLAENLEVSNKKEVYVVTMRNAKNNTQQERLKHDGSCVIITIFVDQMPLIKR